MIRRVSACLRPKRWGWIKVQTSSLQFTLRLSWTSSLSEVSSESKIGVDLTIFVRPALKTGIHLWDVATIRCWRKQWGRVYTCDQSINWRLQNIRLTWEQGATTTSWQGGVQHETCQKHNSKQASQKLPVMSQSSASAEGASRIFHILELERYLKIAFLSKNQLKADELRNSFQKASKCKIGRLEPRKSFNSNGVACLKTPPHINWGRWHSSWEESQDFPEPTLRLKVQGFNNI